MQRAGNRVPNYPETQNYVKTVMQLYSMLKPPSMGLTLAPGRVRVELPAGGAAGRGNLPPALVSAQSLRVSAAAAVPLAAAMPEQPTERD